MKPPCMVVVQQVLPSLRVAISRELVETHGLKKSKVAKLMGLTPAAITQYLNKTRGSDLELSEKSSRVKNLVSEIAQDMTEGTAPPDMLLLKMCMVCQIIRSEGLLCELHIEAMPSLGSSQPCACSLGLIEEKLK